MEFEEIPAEVKPVPIEVPRLLGSKPPSAVTGERTFTFGIASGYCVGGPKPRIDHVRVIERPVTKARPFKSTVITAFLLYPARLRVIPPSPPPPHVAYNVCVGIGLYLTKRIKLKRPTDDLFIYDGSYPNPHRVWPAVK